MKTAMVLTWDLIRFTGKEQNGSPISDHNELGLDDVIVADRGF